MNECLRYQCRCSGIAQYLSPPKPCRKMIKLTSCLFLYAKGLNHMKNQNFN